MSASTKGFLLGILGVAIFAVTLPMTKLATAHAGFSGLSPVFITFGRAAVAGILSILYLLAVRSRRPDAREAVALLLAGLGIVIGFPLFMGLAVQFVDAMHASVIAGALPLGTAILTALWMRERASARFWALAVFGFMLVLAYAYLASGGKGLVPADGLLLLAMASASAGYVLGARLSHARPAEEVICWILVLYLPLTIPVTLWFRPTITVESVAWWAFAYLAVFSMWLGFFAWYRGLALGGAMRVSQTQLLQPFLSMVVAVPLLGERLDALSVFFCLAIIATVAVSRKVK